MFGNNADRFLVTDEERKSMLDAIMSGDKQAISDMLWQVYVHSYTLEDDEQWVKEA